MNEIWRKDIFLWRSQLPDLILEMLKRYEKDTFSKKLFRKLRFCFVDILDIDNRIYILMEDKVLTCYMKKSKYLELLRDEKLNKIGL